MNSTGARAAGGTSLSFVPLGIVFFVSGVPALLYQLCWQRMLFTVYGVNIESITVVVSAFMLGLGLGSLWGGRLTRTSRLAPLVLFVLLEISIALFGVCSPWIFARVSELTLGASLPLTAVSSFVLVGLPTVFMGASLPLLVAHLLARSKNVGHSVGLLYFVNTLGSAAACFIAVAYTFEHFGLSGTIHLAALLNTIVALGAFAVHRFTKAGSARPRRDDADGLEPNERPSSVDVSVQGPREAQLVPFALVLALSTAAGFISLSYEMLLARALSFVAVGRASSFPLVLGSYLLGIAVGSYLSGVYCARSKATRRAQVKVVGVYFLVVNLLGFVTIPLIGELSTLMHFSRAYPLVALLSAGLGATLPLVTHVGIAADERAPQKLSYVYVWNIVGSTVGSLLTGFWAMDVWPLPVVVTSLSAVGILLSGALLAFESRRVGKVVAAVTSFSLVIAIVLARAPAFFEIYEKLLRKEDYKTGEPFRQVVERRGGVVTVTRGGMVYGGGIYDGQLSVSLVYDKNGLVRPMTLFAFHPKPERILFIGLATGAWAQLMIHHPEVKELLAVEINPAYLEIISVNDPVKSLLESPKFQVVIDDGRRYLKRNPDEKFDLIVMNTTFHYHAYAANLLSLEFMSEVKAHLLPGGIAIYNTTSSDEAMRTGATVFPHALRFFNNMFVSESPLVHDKARFAQLLQDYRIDGRPLFDLSDAHHRSRYEHTLGLLEHFTVPPDMAGFERRADLLKRTAGARLITDDNMGTEWTHDFEEEDAPKTR